MLKRPRPRFDDSYRALHEALLVLDTDALKDGGILTDAHGGSKHATYERDAAVRSSFLAKRGLEAVTSSDGGALDVPIFTVAANPAVPDEEWRSAVTECLGDERDAERRLTEQGRRAVRRQIDVETLRAINAAAPADHCVSVSGTLQPENLLRAMAYVSAHEIPVRAIVMHPDRFYECDAWDLDGSIGKSGLQVLRRDNEDLDPDDAPLWAMFKGCPLYVSTMVPKSAVYVLGPKHYLGAIPVEAHLTTVSDHEAARHGLKCRVKEGRRGWVVYSKIGIAVLNDYAVARIVVDTGAPDWELVRVPRKEYEALIRKAEAYDRTAALSRTGEEREDTV